MQQEPPKCENRIPFKVLSLFPRFPDTHKNITNWTPNGPRNCKLWEKWAPKKTTKNKPLKSHQKYQACLKLGTPGAAKVRPICIFSQLFAPGPEMGQESSRGPKRVAQGVQKVPKGFQKVAKSHEKDIHKASTRHPNAIRRCIGNSVGNSLNNAIANAIANATGNRRPLRSMKTNTQTWSDKATKQQKRQQISRSAKY